MNDEWAVVLDLGADPHASELDTLYLESVLRDAHIPVQFYPWHPSDDVLTPLGAVRPLKVLVPGSHVAEAREIAADVLPQDGLRREAVIPVADAWVLPYYLGVIVRHVMARARERGGIWLGLLQALRLYALLQLGIIAFVLLIQPLLALLGSR